MSFALSKVPGTLHTCEMHGKRAKRTANNEASPSREKRVALSLDLTDKKYSRVLDECWPGFDLLAKAMSGADSGAQDLVAHRRMADVCIKLWAIDGATEIFSISVAHSLGRPTLRIGASAAKVSMRVTVVGPISAACLKAIDEHCDCEVLVDIAVVQTEIGDVIDATQPTSMTPKRARATRTKETIDVVDQHTFA